MIMWGQPADPRPARLPLSSCAACHNGPGPEALAGLTVTSLAPKTEMPSALQVVVVCAAGLEGLLPGGDTHPRSRNDGGHGQRLALILILELPSPAPAERQVGAARTPR